MAGVKLHIPRLGDKIVLAEPWTFTLYDESRNDPLARWLGIPIGWDERKPLLTNPDAWHARFFTKPVILPAGTELTVRRLYMRQGSRDFDSMTFSAALMERKSLAEAFKKKPKLKAVRFWAKLDEVNQMQVLHAGGIPSTPQVEVWGKETGPEVHVPLLDGAKLIPVALSRQYINQEVEKCMANLNAAFANR
jgi:hypothetical protein